MTRRTGGSVGGTPLLDAGHLIPLGCDEHLDRMVAIKRVQLDEGAAPDEHRLAVERRRREARIAARLHHPHVVALFEMVEDGDDAWLVMEYLPSRNMSQLVAEAGGLERERDPS